MWKKLVLALLFLSTFQLLNAQAPLACNQKVNLLQQQISTVASQTQSDVSLTASVINRNISLTRFTIKNALISLKAQANSAIGPNAQICKNKLGADLASVNEQALNVCYPNAELNILKQRLNQQISILKRSANSVCQTCLDDACIEEQIDNIQQQAQDVQQQASSEADAIQQAAAQCTEGVGKDQLQTVQNSSDNFDACIKGA